MEIQFDRIKSAKFPPDSNNDELSILHADLAEYDGYIAGIIESKLNGRDSSFELYYDSELEKKIEQFLKFKASSKEERELAQEYLKYLKKIKDLVQ